MKLYRNTIGLALVILFISATNEIPMSVGKFITIVAYCWLVDPIATLLAEYGRKK